MTCIIIHSEEGIDGEAVVEHLGTTVDLPLQTRGSEVDTFARGIKMDFLTHSLISNYCDQIKFHCIQGCKKAVIIQ